MDNFENKVPFVHHVVPIDNALISFIASSCFSILFEPTKPIQPVRLEFLAKYLKAIVKKK